MNYSFTNREPNFQEVYLRKGRSTILWGHKVQSSLLLVLDVDQHNEYKLESFVASQRCLRLFGLKNVNSNLMDSINL